MASCYHYFIYLILTSFVNVYSQTLKTSCVQVALVMSVKVIHEVINGPLSGLMSVNFTSWWHGERMLCLCIWYAPLILPDNTLSWPLTPSSKCLVGTNGVSCDFKRSGVKGVLGVSDTLTHQAARQTTLTAEPTEYHL